MVSLVPRHGSISFKIWKTEIYPQKILIFLIKTTKTTDLDTLKIIFYIFEIKSN